MVPFIYQHFIKRNLEIWIGTGSAYPQHSLNFKPLNCKLLSFEIQAPKPTLEMDV